MKPFAIWQLAMLVSSSQRTKTVFMRPVGTRLGEQCVIPWVNKNLYMEGNRGSHSQSLYILRYINGYINIPSRYING